MALFVETARENWALAGGVQYYVEEKSGNLAILQEVYRGTKRRLATCHGAASLIIEKEWILGS